MTTREMLELIHTILRHEVVPMLHALSHKEDKIMVDLTGLTAQVAQTTSVEASAVALIQGIAAQLAAALASTDPTAINALQVQLAASADALAAAVAANTPA